jgi:hypothetical protein
VTTVTVRPIRETWKSHAVNLVGNSSTWGAVSDNTDSSYVQAQVGYNIIHWQFAQYAMASNERCASVTLRVRSARDGSGGSSQDIAVKTYTYVSGAGRDVQLFGIAKTGTAISTRSGPVQKTAESGHEWDQTRLNNLYVEIEWFQPHVGVQNVFQRIYEVYADLNIQHAPTVSAPVVTNIVNDATPSITWTFTDPDGGNQAGYQIKIFDAATVAKANFSAAASEATWDSGQIFSVQNNIDVPVNLQNGVTYYAYISGAKAGIGTQTYWWSSWSASAPFTVTFTPPYVPVIQSATVVSDSSQYRALLRMLVPNNLLTLDNSSFESSLGQWQPTANCSLLRDTAFSADGVASMRMTASGAGDMSAHAVLDLVGSPRVDVGQTYTAVASFRAASTARTVAVGIEWLDVNGISLSIVYGTNADISTGWTQAQVSAVAPAGAVNALANVLVQGAATGEVHRVDKVGLVAGTSTAWIPGGYTNDQLGIYVERADVLYPGRGPVHNWIHPQAAGGSLTRNAGQAFAWDATRSTLVWQWLDKSLPGPNNPPGMLRWTPVTSNGQPTVEIGHAFYGGTDYAAMAAPGQQMIFSMWMWTDTGTASVTPAIWFRDWTGLTVVGTQNSTPVTLTTTPQRVTAIATAPAGAAFASGFVTNTTSDYGKHLFFTKAGIGLGSIPVDQREPLGGDLTWSNVRFIGDQNTEYFAGLAPGFQTGQVVMIPDYEFPPGRSCIYRASIAYSTAGNFLVSDYATAVIYSPPPSVTLLRSTTNPALQVAVARRREGTFSISEDSQVFHPIGADRAPIKVRDWISGEDGSLTIITSTESQMARLRALIYGSGDVLQVQWSQGGRTFIAVTGITSDETIEPNLKFCDADGQVNYLRYNITTVSYIETASP